MKKTIFTVAAFCLAAATTGAFAQETKEDKGNKETQEIIIRKKGDKDSKVTVEIKGDKVTINGKPLSEFKDDEITINKRNIIIRDGKGNTRLRVSPEDVAGMPFWNDDEDREESGAFLGVTTSVYTEDSKNNKAAGAQITDVTAGSAAEKAGLKKGDVIVSVNDKKVSDPASLSEVVTSFKPKDEVTVYFNRDGKGNSTKAVLGERKISRSMAYAFTGPDGQTRSFTIPRVNVQPKIEMWNDKEFGDMNPRMWSPGAGNNFDFFTEGFPRQQKLGLKIQDTENGEGVKVLEVDGDSPADKAGIKKDDVIMEIGGKKVGNTDEAREQLRDNMEKSTYTIKVKRNGSIVSFDIKIPKKLKTADL